MAKCVHASAKYFISLVINTLTSFTGRSAWGWGGIFWIREGPCAANEVSDTMNNLRAQSEQEDDELSAVKTLGLVRRLIEKIEQQLDVAGTKGSVADYIKLIQIQKELEDKRFRRIEVRWVEDD